MIAFVLASYAPNTPAGIERATAALAAGLRERGHDTIIITGIDSGAPGVTRLQSLKVSFPTDDHTLRRAIDAPAVSAELGRLLHQHRADTVVYTDALWGLGRAMADHPARKVLAVHVVGHDKDLRLALATADVVLAPSATVLAQATERGYRTSEWKVVPNALLHDEGAWAWLDQVRREKLRTKGPIRMLARPAPEKGVDQLLTCIPRLDRRVEVTLGLAPFELHDGHQNHLVSRCLKLDHPRLQVHAEGLAWREVPGWLAEAAVVIVPSLAETFGLVALEALSVGTPVIAYNVGNLPTLIGSGADAAGIIVDSRDGPNGLWQAAMAITQDPVTYRRTSRAAYYRSRDFRPTTIAESFIKAVW